MADTKVSALTAATDATAADLLYLVDEATTSKKITFANFEGSVDHDNLTNTHNLTTDIDHTAISNIGSNSHAAIDTHIASSAIHFSDAASDGTLYGRKDGAWESVSVGAESDPIFNAASGAYNTHIASSAIHFTEASIDHTAITNIGTNTHAQIDTHIASSSIHFTEASIDHTAITNIGTTSHADIDTHIASTAIHFTEASIDHTAITNIGTNSHAAIDTHIASSAIHFTISNIMGVQVHAADGTVSRANSFDVVTWIGSTEPLYANNNDVWIDTS